MGSSGKARDGSELSIRSTELTQSVFQSCIAWLSDRFLSPEDGALSSQDDSQHQLLGCVDTAPLIVVRSPPPLPFNLGECAPALPSGYHYEA